MRHRLSLIVVLTAVFSATSVPLAQEKVDQDIQWKIRREAADNSQIMRTMHFLTDVYGPRLTGSPNLKAAQDWIVEETTRWGLKNAHLEPWSFGHPGWVNERLQSRRRGGTDSTAFNEAGLPGIGIQQDPIEYGSYTWHTNLDTYERIIETDAQQSAMVIAAAVYHLAMRDQMLPRLAKDKMPPLPTP